MTTIANTTEQTGLNVQKDQNFSALRFITCGSVDDGKSTLIGRLLVDSRSVLQDQVAGVTKGGEVDLMCGNFESTLAGKDAGYSVKKRPEEHADTFNAPDVIIDNLKDIGFDFLSTGNNHALDRKMAGLLRTLDVLDEKGI